MLRRTDKSWRVALLILGVLAAPAMATTAADDASAGEPADAAVPAPAAPARVAENESDITEITVTATRQAQSLSKVPISVTAFTAESMDTEGVRGISDLSRLTPGLNFSQSSGLRSNITIRGVASTAGTATTGVYIDDTPVQTRVIGVSSSNVYPEIFDLERVEVLRGPQGTLFGAGSEGGTVRFIETSPSLTEYSGYTRAEYSNTTGSSDPSYEMGGAFGGPIIDNTLGFRVAAWYRKDGGWINRVVGTAQVIDPTGKEGINSINFVPTGQGDPDANWQETSVLRGALGWSPVDGLTVTGSILYQKQYNNDQDYSIWPAASNYSSSYFVTPLWVASDTPNDPNHQYIPKSGVNGLPGVVTNEPYNDRFYLPAIKIDWALGPVTLATNTSYFDDRRSIVSDYTMSHETTYAHRQVPNPGDEGWSWNSNVQQQLTQEIRLSSSNPAARFNWVVGGFYEKAHQGNEQVSWNNFVNNAPSISVAPVAGFPTPAPAVNNGSPYGPGSTAFENYYGIDPIYGIYQYYAHLVSEDKQIAGFLQIDFAITSQLKLIAGVREAHDTYSLIPTYGGPITNLNLPQGRNCVPGTGAPGGPACIVPPANTAAGSNGYWPVGTGPFAPAFVSGTQSAAENANTPRAGLDYQINDNNMVYGTASKGFRPGGAQQQQPANCDAQIVSYGYVNADGSAAPPSTFKSDSLWNYEIGSKNKLFDGHLSIDSSVYLIKWSNIQTSVSLSSCLQSFFANLGSATGKGFDLQAIMEPLPHLLIGPTVSYNKITFDANEVLGGRTVYTKGSVIPGSGAPWTAILSGDYSHKLINDWMAYGHVDYTYTSAQDPSGITDPGTVSYDPMLTPPPATTLVNGRVGVRLEGLDVSLFINNLTNAHPDLNLTRTSGQPVYTDYTFRPRTAGVTATYRW